MGYLKPDLLPAERAVALVEGWIGITRAIGMKSNVALHWSVQIGLDSVTAASAAGQRRLTLPGSSGGINEARSKIGRKSNRAKRALDWSAVWRLEKVGWVIARGERVKTVLFLCTGNYYRSRFAEEFFNHHADCGGLDWRARSRGLALERGMHNVGFISPLTLHALGEMKITARGAGRLPQQCTADDLVSADFVIAVKEEEHRPLMRERFAAWEHRLDYWNVHDVELAEPSVALEALAQKVQRLLLRLAGGAMEGEHRP